MEATSQKVKSALVIHPSDNVAVALTDLKKGEPCTVRSGEDEYIITINDDIHFGHKFAISIIEENESALKYGEEIGKMSSPVQKGEWVHTHNMYCERGRK
ncbi:UxaA family hydrolase [Bacillus sp. Marseille-Q3570]|uniref:UxaA family hydrolase n=1 Tax=Bacillus sp. Marseille-Q3570 TaxID=2963522 RepID=UPI0021B70F72|nr:UxaA family hydrolase [Bacillus sp. Marseille-Q3570]